MQLKIQASKVFRELNNSTKKIVVLEGGARSTKTWSLFQWIIINLLYRDWEEELALYRELHGAYWVRNTLRQFVAVAVIGISLYLSSQSVDLEAAAYALLTLVVTVTYLKGN